MFREMDPENSLLWAWRLEELVCRIHLGAMHLE